LLSSAVQNLEVLPLEDSQMNRALLAGNQAHKLLEENVKPNEAKFWDGVIPQDKILSTKREINEYGLAPEQAGGDFPNINDTQRNQSRANNIEVKLRSNPKAKVAFIDGSYHLEQGPNQAETPTAVQLLRRDKLNVTTFQPQIGGARDEQTGYDPLDFTLFPLTGDVKQPVSVSTSDARTMGRLPLWMPGRDAPRDTMSNWNNVLIFPSAQTTPLADPWRAHLLHKRALILFVLSESKCHIW